MQCENLEKECYTVTMRYRMSSRDVFYGGGIVNGARSVTYMEDLANRLMTKVFKNTGRCTKVEKIRFYSPVRAGDYMEFIARVAEIQGKSVKIECRSFKVAEVPANPEFESSIDVLEEPEISSAITFWYESLE